MRIALVSQKPLIILKKDPSNTPKLIRARRPGSGVKGDERHRFTNCFSRDGRAYEIGTIGGSHMRRSVDGLQGCRPGNRHDVKAIIAAEIAKRRRVFGADYNDS